MAALKAFPDVEPALIVYLEDLGYGVTWTPPDLKEQLVDGNAVLRIKRIGGGSTLKSDEPRISVQAYTLRDAAKPRSSHKVQRDVEARIQSIGEIAPLIEVPEEFGGGKVRLDSGDKEAGPVELPYPDEQVLVVESIYRVSTRR